MEEQRRIAIFLPSVRGGGAERAMTNLANAFALRRYNVDMVLASAEGPYLTDLDSTVRVVDLKCSRVMLSLPGLVKYLRRARPDAMISAMSHANVIAVVARSVCGAQMPLVVTEHTSTTSSTWIATDLRNRTVRMLMKRTYPAARAVTVVADAMARDLASRLKMEESRLVTIHNPVVTRKLAIHAAEQPQHPWMGNYTSPVILAVGRLTKAKDFPTLIHAMAELRAKGRPERLIILGDGEERGALENLIEDLALTDRIDLPGFVINPFAFMSRAALFVLSSRWEGLPTVLIEAMACGAPVVSTDCPTGPAEILENGEWGALVPVGDADALAQAMIEMLDRRDRPDVRRRATDFSEDRAVSHYLEVLGLG